MSLIEFFLPPWKFHLKPGLYHTVPTCNEPKKKERKENFWKLVGKGENAGYQHFLLFSQCFLPISKNISVLSNIFCRLQLLSIWTGLKFAFW